MIKTGAHDISCLSRRNLWDRRTDGVVFEHAQRLMRTRPLHCAIIARHCHRDEAYHNGTRLRCGRILAQSWVLKFYEEGGFAETAECSFSIATYEDNTSQDLWKKLHTFLGHGDEQLRVMLAMAVVVLNREVSTILGLGGGSSAAAAATNQEVLRTATAPPSRLTSPMLLLVVMACRYFI